MQFLFLILVALAIYHFLLESTILPSTRLCIRFELFALRDQLRTLKIEQAETISDEVFENLQGAINTSIRLLPQLLICTIVTASATIQSDESLQKRIEKRKQVFESCAVEQVQVIRNRVVFLTVVALLVNSTGWVIYLIPFIPVFTFSVISRLKTKVKTLLVAPSGEVDRLIPNLEPSPA